MTRCWWYDDLFWVVWKLLVLGGVVVTFFFIILCGMEMACCGWCGDDVSRVVSDDVLLVV